MSQSNPNPEERSRIVNAALGRLQKKYVAAEPNDLDRLFGRLEHAVKTANEKFQPILNAAGTLTADHPLYVHSPQGRAQLNNELHKLFLSEFKNFDKDELLFLLAFVHTQMCLERHV